MKSIIQIQPAGEKLNRDRYPKNLPGIMEEEKVIEIDWLIDLER